MLEKSNKIGDVIHIWLQYLPFRCRCKISEDVLSTVELQLLLKHTQMKELDTHKTKAGQGMGNVSATKCIV